jgi:ubiquinone/menaquinone biosynthesis C-methylase UbiE
MAGFDPQAFMWEYRASRREPRRYDALMTLVPPACARVLDAGCGGGRLAVRLATTARCVIGLDLSEAMLAFAQKRHAAENLRDITWVRGDLRGLPFPSSVFDCVVGTSVLHLVDLDRCLPELKRVAKPGGRLVLQDLPLPRPGRRSVITRYRSVLSWSMRALLIHGVRPAWLVTAHQWQALRRWNGTFASLAHDRVREACLRHLPGWQLAQSQDLLILWDKPREETR